MRQLKQITTHEAPMERHVERHLTKQAQKQLISGLGVCVIAGILLSILAPYNTGRISFLPRLTYWTLLCVAGGIGAAIFEPMTRAMNWSPNRLWSIIGQSITSSLMVTAMLIGWNYYQGNQIDLLEAIVLFFFVLVIGVTITAVVHLVEQSGDKTETSPHRPAIFERLKPKFRNAEIFALMAEDHYVRVITSNGDDLILMRLSDAVKELGDLKGLSTHRSWWVAESGVKSTHKADGKITLELHNGQKAPVSRSKAKTVKDAGWV